MQARSIGKVIVENTHESTRPVIPRQLPLAARGFVGRTEHLAALDALLPNADGSGGDAVVISALDGTAGVGKTTLAVHWAHRVQHHFPDGTLHTNLRGYAPGDPATPTEVLDGFLHTLGIPLERIPTGVEARSSLYRSILAGRRMLIVLDNANAASQVRPLLPGSPGCLVLVTSRASLTGLVVNDGATRVTLDLLTPQEAIDLVREIIGQRRVDAEPDATAELIRHCARLPLALRIAAGRVAAQPHLDVADLVAEIADDQNRWDALSLPDEEDAAVRVVFDWSYRRLTAEHAHVFRRLGLHPGPDFSLHAAAAVAGLTVARARRVLNLLADTHLVEHVSRDRYRFHDLLRAYAADCADHDDHLDDRDRACRLLLEWYTHHVTAAHHRLFPERVGWHPALELEIDTHPEITFAQPADALTWFDADRVNLIAACRDAHRRDVRRITIPLTYATSVALRWRGHWEESLGTCRLGLAAARRCGDDIAEAHALLQLGEIQLAGGRWDHATDPFELARALARDLDNAWLEAAVLNGLARLHLDQRGYAKAKEFLQLALPLSPGAQRGRIEALIEGNLSIACTGLDQYEQALQHAERGLVLRRQSGDRSGEAVAWHHMALAKQRMGDHERQSRCVSKPSPSSIATCAIRRTWPPPWTP